MPATKPKKKTAAKQPAKKPVKKAAPLGKKIDTIKGLITTFCNANLNEEYHKVCQVMADQLNVAKSPLKEGKENGWAAAIVAAIGFVNFLGDPRSKPHLTDKDIAEGFSVTQALLKKNTNTLIKGFDLIPYDPDFTIASLLDDNPFVWLIETESGMTIDLRQAPLDLQKQALEMGLIPYMPPTSMENEGCCDAGGCGMGGCCEGGGCSSGPCEKVDCCQLEVKETKSKGKGKPKAKKK